MSRRDQPHRPPNRPRGHDDDDLAPSLHAVDLAARTELPNGRFKGMTIAQVHDQSPDYVRWMADTWTGRIGQAARCYLQAVDPTNSQNHGYGMGPPDDRQAICQKIDKLNNPDGRRSEPSAKSKN